MFWIVVAPAAVTAAEETEAIPSAEEILANPLDDSAYVDDVRCLAVGRYRQVDILNDRALVFRGRGGRAWINLLPRPCPGLRRDMVLAIETRGSRICNRDQFRGIFTARPTFFEPGSEIDSFDVLRDDIEWTGFRAAHVMHGHYARMIQVGYCAGLGQIQFGILRLAD